MANRSSILFAVTGRIDKETVTRYIENYQASIPEQIESVQREIREEFENMGYNKEDVKF